MQSIAMETRVRNDGLGRGECYGVVPKVDVIASVHTHVDALKTRGLVEAIRKAEVVISGAGMSGDRTKLQTLKGVLAKLDTVIADYTACSRGCDHCCKMAVSMSSIEAEMIGQSIFVRPRKPETNMDGMEMVDAYKGVDCPFLVDKVCSIYDHRPIACRAHHNISKYPDLCDVIGNPGSDVPALNFTFAHAAYVQFFFDSEFNDIREFFPNGLRSE